MAGSVVMTIFVYKGLTRNPKIGNTSVSVLPNIWRLGQVKDTKFVTNVSFVIKCYWMMQNSRVIAFTVSEVLTYQYCGTIVGIINVQN